MLFTGHKDQSLDAKDRVVIPANYRAVIEAEHGSCVYVVPDETASFLEAYPQRVFEAMAADLLEAEAQRDAVTEAKAETETTMSTEFTAREQELEVRLRETQAELEAAMEGLRAARQELSGKN